MSQKVQKKEIYFTGLTRQQKCSECVLKNKYPYFHEKRKKKDNLHKMFVIVAEAFYFP